MGWHGAAVGDWVGARKVGGGGFQPREAPAATPGFDAHDEEEKGRPGMSRRQMEGNWNEKWEQVRPG